MSIPDFRLAQGISHCSFPGCAIVLDIRRDRYWRVEAAAASALDLLAGRRSGVADPGILERLHRQGLIEPATQSSPGREDQHPPSARPPSASALESDIPATRFHAGFALEVAADCLAARLATRMRPLASIVSHVAAQRTTLSRRPVQESATLARVFARYRALVPFAPACLPDTLAFLRFAARRGHFPNLVFGVEAWPFAAHCWAQHEDVVLTDALQHARSFSVILTV